MLFNFVARASLALLWALFGACSAWADEPVLDSPLLYPIQPQGPVFLQKFFTNPSQALIGNGMRVRIVHESDFNPAPLVWHGEDFIRTRTFVFEACLDNPLDGPQASKSKVEVIKRHKVVAAGSLEGACFKWSESVKYNLLARAQFVYEPRSLRLLPPKGHEKILTQNLYCFTNPWLGDKTMLSSPRGSFCIKNRHQVEAYSFLPLVSFSGEPGTGSGANLSTNPYMEHVKRPLLVQGLKAQIIHTNWNKCSMPKESVVAQKTQAGYAGLQGLKLLPLNIELSMQPFVFFSEQAHQGFSRQQYSFNRPAEFRVWLYLMVEEAQSQRHIVNPLAEPQVVSLNTATKRLHLCLPTLVTEKLKEGQYYLAVKLEPLLSGTHANSAHLQAFESLFYLTNSWSNILGSHTPVQSRAKKHFSLAAYMQGAKNASEWKNRLYQGPQNSKDQWEHYSYNRVDARFLRISPNDETSTVRTVEFAAKVCIKHSKNGKPVKGRKFIVERVADSRSGKKDPAGKYYLLPQANTDLVQVESDDEGCIEWNDKIRHRYYIEETYIFPSAKVWSPAHKDEIKTLSLVINPWDEKWTFGRDRRDLSEQYLAEVTDREAIESRFYLQDYGYQTLRFRYHVDKYLGLKVKKTLLLRIHPKAVRYSSIIRGRQATEYLRDGVYLLKVALEKPYLDPASKGLIIGPGSSLVAPNSVRVGAQLKTKEYVTAVRKLVRVQNGTIITPIELSIRDLRLMKIRSNFLIQLETVDEKKLFRAINFRACAGKDLSDKMSQCMDGSIAEKEAFVCGDKGEGLVLDEYFNLLDKDYKNQPPNTGAEDFSLAADSAVSKAPSCLEKFYKNSGNLNDFTVANISPLLFKDLDEYVDADSGLKKRTFTGPMVLIANTNYAAVRPTDNLEEVHCSADDCNEINAVAFNKEKSSGSYDHSKYFGSVRHLYNKSVDDVIESYQKHESRYLTQMAAFSLMHHFVDTFMLDYVSLEDHPILSFDPAGGEACQNMSHEDYSEDELDCGGSGYNVPNILGVSSYADKATCFWDKLGCIKVGSPWQVGANMFSERMVLSKPSEHRDLWSKFLKAAPGLKESSVYEDHSVRSHDVMSIIDHFFVRDTWSYQQRMEYSPDQHFRDLLSDNKHFFSHLCVLMSQAFENPHTLESKIINTAIAKECLNRVRDNNTHKAFSVEKRYRIASVTGNYNFKGGKSFNINVGDSFRIFRDGFYKYSTKFAPFGKALGIMSGGMLGLDWSQGNAHGYAESTTVNSQTFLVMQTAALDIELKQYEKCLVLKWRPSFLHPVGNPRASFFMGKNWWSGEWRMRNAMGEMEHVSDSDLSQLESAQRLVNKIMLGGIMICSGKLEDKPVAIRERYYYTTQHFTDGDMLDPGDLYNHPWLLQLRGVRDFETFIQAARAQNMGSFISPDNLTNKKPLHSSWQWPIKKLNQTYRNVMPSFPGMFVQMLREEEETDYPWVTPPDVNVGGPDMRPGATLKNPNSWGLEYMENANWTQQPEGTKPRGRQAIIEKVESWFR